jgi:hypothetical protein
MPIFMGFFLSAMHPVLIHVVKNWQSVKKSFVLVVVVIPAPYQARDKLRRVSSNLLKRLDSRSLLTACWDKLHQQ